VARKTAKIPVNKPVVVAPRSRMSARANAQAYPDAWADLLKLRVDGHPFDMRGREFQRDIIRDESEWIIVPKGAQMGLTTIFLVRTFHWIVKRKWHQLYLMPLKTGAIPFVQGRIDPIIDSNAELKAHFKNVDNRLHKQSIDDIALRIRGTNIWTELREIPADCLVMDERDKMIEDNIPEAMARLDGSDIKRKTELSTPTAPGHGVDAEDAWHASDQHRWYIPCPHCSRRQTITVDENIVIGDMAEECSVRCVYCHKEISDQERAAANAFGTWESDNPGGRKRGYQINQLNSPTQTIAGFMENYFLGQVQPKKLRAWYNNNRGEPFVSAGDQITPELIRKCIPKSGHSQGGLPTGPVYVGVDVGNVLHVRADYIDRYGRRIFWQAKIFADKPANPMWDQLDTFLAGLGSFTCIIDAHPEKSEAKKLALKYHKRVWIGFEQDRPDQAETGVFNTPKAGEVGKVNIDRTDAFDMHVGRLMGGRMIMPSDVETIGEIMPRLPYNGYMYQLCQMAASEEEDTKGRNIRRWVKNKNPDHWHHADMFCEIATMKKPHISISASVGELFARSGSVISSAA
jgi:hypothetical protein